MNPNFTKKTTLAGFLFLLFFSIIIKSNAQQQSGCTGTLGTPVISITFGSGTTNPGLQLSTVVPGATTSYNFASYATGTPPSPPLDGDYALVNVVPQNSAWFSGATDHTGNPNGYMAFFNASPTPGEFYRQNVTGLASGTTYEFGAWIANVINAGVLPSGILPNITFEILDSATHSVISSYNTGNIANSFSMTWIKYGLLFTVPVNVHSVTLSLSNNNIGGTQRPGNDLAIDDITFSPCLAAGPTPLTLTSFQGNIVHTSAVLTWTTYNEINTAADIIERSYDGNHFAPVGSLASRSLLQENKYQFIDHPSLLNKTVYYRLKLMDKDGKYTNSKILAIRTNLQAAGTVSLFPNPAKDYVQVTYSAAREEFTLISIKNVLGKTIMTQTNHTGIGANSVLLNFQNKLPAGVYFVQFAVNGKSITNKLVVN